MALFGFSRKKFTQGGFAPGGKKDEVKDTLSKVETAVEKKSSSSGAVGNSADLFHVLRNPRITEKATAHAEIGVYLFDVSQRATKRSISKAVEVAYSVKPRMVRIVTIPAKVRRSMRTGKRGVKQGGKKAYVYLKRGDTITLT